MKIKFLKAYNGDSIIINFIDQDNTIRNILIDGGTKQTYQFKNSKGKIEDGELKKELKKIENNNQLIDLLILTHVDDDHIGGLLHWIENNKNFNKLVRRVWFNSGDLIFNKFKHKEEIDNSIKINFYINTDTSIKKGITFEEYITSNNIWQKELIYQQKEYNIHGAIFQILTPSVDNLKKLLHKWEKEYPESLTSKSNDYNKTLSQLNKTDIYVEDSSIYNGSSISFIISYENKKYLHLSDAHPSDVVNGLKHFGYNQSKKLKAGIVKLSHHGSKKNTSVELLNCIDSNLFIISSNGKVHNLPDKQCLARIVKNKPSISFGFNYPNKIAEIFTEIDYTDYEFNAIGLETEITL